MVKKRMAMRMLTIFVALIVSGMFFPDLARGAGLSSDQGVDVDFGDVVVGEAKTIPLEITNENGSTLNLYPSTKIESGCGFTFTNLGTTQLDPGAALNVEVTFSPSPSKLGACTASLTILHKVSQDPYAPLDNATITFTANGVEKPPEPPEPKNIFIGGIDTSVEDRIDGDGDYIGDTISECQESALNHGQWVGCVLRYLRELRMEERISPDELRVLQNKTVQAAIQNLMHEIREANRSGRTNYRGMLWHSRHLHR